MQIIQAPCLRADTISLAIRTSWISTPASPLRHTLVVSPPTFSKALNSQMTLMRIGLLMLLVAELQLSHW